MTSDSAAGAGALPGVHTSAACKAGGMRGAHAARDAARHAIRSHYIDPDDAGCSTSEPTRRSSRLMQLGGVLRARAVDKGPGAGAGARGQQQQHLPSSEPSTPSTSSRCTEPAEPAAAGYHTPAAHPGAPQQAAQASAFAQLLVSSPWAAGEPLPPRSRPFPCAMCRCCVGVLLHLDLITAAHGSTQVHQAQRGLGHAAACLAKPLPP
jgi:hypothetical protein